MIRAIILAITAALNVFKSERDIRNNPAQVKNELDKARQAARDRLNAADAVAADPTASKEAHEAALKTIRLAHS